LNATFKFNLSRIDRPILIAVAVWILAMIAVPIQRWVWGEDALTTGITLGVLLQVIAVLVTLWRGWRSLRRVLALLIVVSAAAWLTEYIGHTTGFPFGEYDYTARMQPQIGGVPLLIPLAWLMMLPPAWAVAQVIIGHVEGWRGRLAFVGMSALAFTAWDLFLDPQMVSWNLWVWNDPGVVNYFGIPYINYAGWLLASGLITTLVLALGIIKPENPLPKTPLLIIYVITWMLQAGGHVFFWGLPGSGIVGFFGMGIFVTLALRAYRKRTT